MTLFIPDMAGRLFLLILLFGELFFLPSVCATGYSIILSPLFPSPLLLQELLIFQHVMVIINVSYSIDHPIDFYFSVIILHFVQIRITTA
jgi:hypothetical protein